MGEPSNKLAVVVATKDRPEKLGNLLTSLSNQDLEPELVVIVSAGIPIFELVKKFSSKLTIVHRHLEAAGQVAQRNYAIQQVPEDFDLIACIDDDIVFEVNSIQAMMRFWDVCPSEVYGAGFNIINMPRHRFHRWLSWCEMSLENPGCVMKCGTPTAITNVQSDTKTDWLNGGTTVWRARVLREILHSPIKASWAVYEDLIFSYPMRSLGELWVVHDAKVDHVDDGEKGLSLKRLIYRFQQVTFWRFIFVSTNPKSLSRWFWFLRVIIDCLVGFIRLPLAPKHGAARIIGTVIGFFRGVVLNFAGSGALLKYYDDKNPIGMPMR